MQSADPGLDLVARHLSERGGPPLGAYKDRCLRRRLAVRMRACGAATLVDYAGLLATSPQETALLLEALTINVTQFFRNPEVWDQLGVLLGPLLQAQGGTLRAWSAGCASGEEPYSLALLAAAATPPPGPGAVQIDATDIDAKSLARAREGRYPASVMQTHALARRLSFEGAEAVVPPDLRLTVRFLHGDLLQHEPPTPPYDLILCRNVIIYFEREAQERLLKRFIDALRPDGLLVLGRVETPTGASRDVLELLHNRERIYRKRG